MDYSIIGIDFGTSSTVVRIKNYHPGMKRNDCQSLVVQGEPTIPTQVFEREDGIWFFGKDVDSEIQAGSKGEVYRNFKMDLINPDEDKRKGAQNITRKFFKYLFIQFNDQREFLNISPNYKTIVSYPAKWTPDVIGFMKQCAIDAGFGDHDSVFGETEPTAAIYAELTHHEEMIFEKGLIAQNIPTNVLLLDMGAGTSDITIFKLLIDDQNRFFIGVQGQIITHPAIDSPYLCGGREIDEALADYNRAYLESVITAPSVPEGLLKVNREGVKEWKEASVSKRLEQDKSAPIPGYLSTTLNMLNQFGMLSGKPYPDIDRKTFECISKGHWSNLISLLRDAIEKASKVIKDFHGPESIDLAIITGGHSQWYCVREILLGKSIAGNTPLNFEKLKKDTDRVLTDTRPQETVACGLVYRDLDYNIKHTASNNLWMRFSLVENGKPTKSPMFHPIAQFDILPKVSRIKWSHSIQAHFMSFSEVQFKCECLYGADQHSAVSLSAKASIKLNSLFQLLFGMVILGPLWGDTAYPINIDASVTVNEDGSGFLTGTVSSEYGSQKQFRIDF